MIFELNEKEEKAYVKFELKHKHKKKNKGAIGGNISVIFTNTSLGSMPSVKCSICGKEKNITDYDCF